MTQTLHPYDDDFVAAWVRVVLAESDPDASLDALIPGGGAWAGRIAAKARDGCLQAMRGGEQGATVHPQARVMIGDGDRSRALFGPPGQAGADYGGLTRPMIGRAGFNGHRLFCRRTQSPARRQRRRDRRHGRAAYSAR